MCTISFFPNQVEGYLLAMNRDEQHSRPAATELRREDGISYPVDPQGGGTWIGVSDRGMAITLLNRYSHGQVDSSKQYKSRGTIIPPLLKMESLDRVLGSIQRLDIREFPSFSLVLFDPRERKVVLFESDGNELISREFGWVPYFLTSSAFETQGIISYRKKLFESFLTHFPKIIKDKVVDFHLTQTPGQEARSILMSQAEARTVSFSLIEFWNGKIEFSYHLIPEDF